MSIVDDTKVYTDNIRNAIYGKEVRSSIADGIDGIANEVSNIASLEILPNENVAKLFAPLKNVVKNKYIPYDNGIERDMNGFCYGSFETEGNKSYSLKNNGAGTQVAFFNGNSYLSGLLNVAGEFTTPASTTKVYISISLSNLEKCCYKLEDDSKELNYNLNKDYLYKTIKPIVKDKYIAYDNGSECSVNGYCYSTIEIGENKRVILKDENNPYIQVAFFNNNTYLSGLLGTEKSFTTPSNTTKMCISIPTNTLDKFGYKLDDSEIKFNFNLNKDYLYKNLSNVTLGKYIAYDNGNECSLNSYCYSVINVKAGETYIFNNAVEIYAQVAFFNNDTYVSGLLYPEKGFIVPEGVNKAYISIPTSKLNSFSYKKGDNKVTDSNKDYILVAKSDGDYSSVTDAVNNAVNGDIIYIKKGVYDNEKIKCWGKNISIIGEDREQVVIKNGYNEYANPPIEMDIGTIENLTLWQYDGGTTGNAGYALHMEHDSMVNGKFIARNVNFKTDKAPAIGIGLRSGCNVFFYNCRFESKENVGAFFHDGLGGTDNQFISFKDCIFYSKELLAPMRINSQKWGGTSITTEFINNVFYNGQGKTPVVDAKNATTNCGDATTVYDLLGLINFHKAKSSYGNNIAELDYVYTD